MSRSIAMVQFADADEAQAAYRARYPSGNVISIKAMTIGDFKRWVESGQTRGPVALAESKDASGHEHKGKGAGGGQFTSGSTVAGGATFVAKPLEVPPGGLNLSKSEWAARHGPDMNIIEGELAGFPITTTERGLIGKVSKKTKAMLEEALGDDDVVQAMKDAGIKNLQLTPHKGPGKATHGWTMGHSNGALLFHTQTGNSIERSPVPERREGGVKRIIYHEAGHGLWNKAGNEKVNAFVQALVKHPEVTAEIAKIVNIKPPRDAWDYDEKARAAEEVNAELNAMKRYDPQRYAGMPQALRDAAEAITGKPVLESVNVLEDKALFGPGFTGTLKDAIGRTMTFVDGKHVKNAGDGETQGQQSVHVKIHGQKVHVVAYDPVNEMVKVQNSEGHEAIVPTSEINRIHPGSAEADQEAEAYMDERMDMLDRLVDRAVESGATVAGNVQDWSDVDEDTQSEVESNYVENNYPDEYDRLVEQWREGLDDKMSEDLRSDDDWHNTAFENWAVEQGFTRESAQDALEQSYKPLGKADVEWKAAVNTSEDIRLAVLDVVNGMKRDPAGNLVGGEGPRSAAAIPVAQVYGVLKAGLYPAIKDDSIDGHAEVGRALDDIAKAQSLKKNRIWRGHTYNADGMFPEFSRLIREGDADSSVDAEKEDELSNQWDEDYEDLKQTELTSRIEAESENVPDEVSEEAREAVSETFSEMSDEQKYQYMRDAGFNQDDEETVQMPDEWKVFHDGEDYEHTRTVARYLQHHRAEQIIAERLAEREEWKGLKVDVEKLTSDVWGSWKSSSTSGYGLALQLATSTELNGFVRMDDIAKRTAEDTFKKIYINAGGRAYNPRFTEDQKIEVGKAILQGYVRATWEASQYALRKAEIAEVTTWRGLVLPKALVDEQGSAEMKKMIRKRDVGEPKNAGDPEVFTALPGISLKRNGCASATTSPGVANSWGGVGAGNMEQPVRVVLRIKSPRTAVLSAPVFGQNDASEQETILAGTSWKEWDAWLNKAPAEGYQPFTEDDEDAIASAKIQSSQEDYSGLGEAKA